MEPGSQVYVKFYGTLYCQIDFNIEIKRFKKYFFPKINLIFFQNCKPNLHLIIIPKLKVLRNRPQFKTLQTVQYFSRTNRSGKKLFLVKSE